MMRARLLVPFFTAASCAALAGIGDGFGLGDNGGFDSAAGVDGAAVTGPVAPTPTFSMVAGATTPNDLGDALTVNGTAMTLVLACDAQGISGTTWTCRDANGAVVLTEAGTGSSPSSSTLTPFRALDSSERTARFANAGKYYEAATSSVGQIDNADAVIEVVTTAGSCASTGTTIGNATPGTGVPGWAIQRTTTNCRGNISVSDGTTTVTTASTTVVWAQGNHALYGIDSGVAVSNGPSLNGATPTTTASTVTNLTSTGRFGIGAVSGGSVAAVGVVSIHVWRCANCITSIAADLAPVARARAAVAFGVSPSIAFGSPAPTALTRATAAHVDVVDGSTRQLYAVGNGAPRVARRTHSGGTAVIGYMSEPAASNIALQSQTLGTTWTAITAGDNVLADAFAGADLSVTGDNIDGNNSAAEHGLRQAVTLTAVTHTFSAWARAGSQSFVALRNATIVNGAAWFNLSQCSTCTIGEDCAAAVGTVQTGVSLATASRWPIDTTGDGVADENLCRVSITFTGTAALSNHDLLCAPSDNALSYTDADATADCGFWGVRLETFPTPTSYLATTTAATARNADDLRFDGASHYTGSPSTMETAVLCPSFDTAVQSTFASVGTGAANYARLGIDATADRGQGGADVAGVQWLITAASGDISDGVAHTLRQTMVTNNIQAYVDGVSIGTDALATLPTVASSFVYLGTAGSTASQSACLINRARLWSTSVAP
jgi:hypothetical protein